MKEHDIVDLVANHRLLTGLPGDTVERVAGCARNVAFRPGELLLAEGSPADTLYLIRRGQVSLEAHAPGRGTLIVETVGPGQPIGWSWLFPPYRWHFDVRAAGRVTAVAVDAVCLRTKADADPAFGYELMKRFVPVMIERMQAARIRLLDLYGADGGNGFARQSPSVGDPSLASDSGRPG